MHLINAIRTQNCMCVLNLRLWCIDICRDLYDLAAHADFGITTAIKSFICKHLGKWGIWFTSAFIFSYPKLTISHHQLMNKLFKHGTISTCRKQKNAESKAGHLLKYGLIWVVLAHFSKYIAQHNLGFDWYLYFAIHTILLLLYVLFTRLPPT